MGSITQSSKIPKRTEDGIICKINDDARKSKRGNTWNKSNSEREPRTRQLRIKSKKHAQNHHRRKDKWAGKSESQTLEWGELRPLIAQRRKIRESAKTTRPTTSNKMGKEAGDSKAWNGERNSFETSAQHKACTFHNQGKT